MQRTIRVLRIVLPVVFVAFVILIVLSWNRAGRRSKDKSTSEPPVATRTGETAQVEAKGCEDTQTIAGRVAMRIRAERVVGYVSGWNTLENVHLTIFRPTGLTYDIACPSAQFNGTTKEADAKGGVKLTSSDGVDVTTAEIHYDGTHLTNHIPVQFRIDRWVGKGGALDLDVQAETVRLFEKMDAHTEPLPDRPAESPMTLAAQEGLFRRKEGLADFTKDVVFTHQADRVTGDHILGRFAPDKKTLSGLEGQGHVVMNLSSNTTVTGGQSEDLGGRKEITCDRFFSELGADGTISALNAVMDQPAAFAHAVIEGPPHRDIVARTFRVALAGKVVSEMRADGQVVMKEFGEIPRELSAEHVTVLFDQITHRAASSVIDGNFHYHDAKNDAKAIRANYDIVNDRVVLSAQPGFDPTIVTDGNTLKAKLIEFSPRAGTARANGEVIAQLVSKPGGGPSADVTSVFPAGKPVFVNSDSLMMRQANKVAVFSGNVRAWQDTNTMFAQEMQVQGAGEQISASGNVRTVLYNTSSNPAEARKTPVLSRSDQLVAHKTERRIDLTGGVKIDDDARHLTSERASFFFDANRKLDHIESENKVVLIDQPQNRKGTGDKATYLVNKRMIYMSGSPATVTAPTGNVTGQNIAIDLTRNKVEIVSATAPTQGTYKQ